MIGVASVVIGVARGAGGKGKWATISESLPETPKRLTGVVEIKGKGNRFFDLH